MCNNASLASLGSRRGRHITASAALVVAVLALHGCPSIPPHIGPQFAACSYVQKTRSSATCWHQGPDGATSRQGPFVAWFAGGQQRTVGTYQDGLRHGVWRWWSASGELCASHSLAHGELVDVGGERLEETSKVELERRDPKAKRGRDPSLACNRDDIRALVFGAREPLTGCFDKVLAKGLVGRAKLRLRWTIGDAGKVSCARAVEDDLGDPEFVLCVEGVIGALNFAAPKRGVCAVDWPFVFTPGA